VTSYTRSSPLSNQIRSIKFYRAALPPNFTIICLRLPDTTSHLNRNERFMAADLRNGETRWAVYIKTVTRLRLSVSPRSVNSHRALSFRHTPHPNCSMATPPPTPQIKAQSTTMSGSLPKQLCLPLPSQNSPTYISTFLTSHSPTAFIHKHRREYKVNREARSAKKEAKMAAESAMNEYGSACTRGSRWGSNRSLGSSQLST